MAYSVQVIFRGLCAFIPSDDDLSAPQPWVGVFLVRADEAARNKLPRPEMVEAHYPYLQFPTKHLKHRSNWPNGDAMFRLDGHDVAFSSPSNVNVSFEYDGSVGERPEPGQETLFNWVSRIESAMKDAGAMAGRALEEALTSSPHLAARVHLNGGTLSTKRVGKFGGESVLAEFGPTDVARPLRQAVAVESVLDLGDTEGDFEVRLQRWNPDTCMVDTPETLAFSPPDGSTLTIQILNLCPRDLVSDPFPNVPYPEPDFDYRWYYRLSEGFDDWGVPEEEEGSTAEGSLDRFNAEPALKLAVPIPIQFGPTGLAGGGGPVRCTPTRFEAPAAGALIRMVQLAEKLRAYAFPQSTIGS